ncbi:hypothetical protein RcapMu1 [Rhodobacter phage RcapMu]|nr:hypothetical protein RcapMu1 [Rhodobacter phage RcapMu]AER29924.1 hypothetical protein RcapMu1 [Rhodobacter phage RcapMu]
MERAENVDTYDVFGCIEDMQKIASWCRKWRKNSTLGRHFLTEKR